jgi:hypothetical protein
MFTRICPDCGEKLFAVVPDKVVHDCPARNRQQEATLNDLGKQPKYFHTSIDQGALDQNPPPSASKKPCSPPSSDAGGEFGGDDEV